MELESIIEKIKELEILAFPISAGIEVLSMRQIRTKEESVNYLKEKEIVIGFSKHFSSVEKTYLRSCKEECDKSLKPRNFTLYFEIKNAEITAHSSHFYWNSSPEGLDFQLQQEIKILRKLRFNINYKGYLKEMNFSI